MHFHAMSDFILQFNDKAVLNQHSLDNNQLTIIKSSLYQQYRHPWQTEIVYCDFICTCMYLCGLLAKEILRN